jgi:hypothetical protein
MSYVNDTAPSTVVEFLASEALDYLMTEDMDYLVTSQTDPWTQDIEGSGTYTNDTI